MPQAKEAHQGKRRAAKKRRLRKHRKPAAKRAEPGADRAAPAPLRARQPDAGDPDRRPTGTRADLPDDPSGGGRSVQVQSGEFYLRLSRPRCWRATCASSSTTPAARTRTTSSSSAAARCTASTSSRPARITPRRCDLDAGTWQLFCALPEHAERGMKAQLSVTSG